MAEVGHADPLDPVNLLAARRAVQDKFTEATFKFSLRLQESDPDHLGRDRDRMIICEAGVHRLVDDGVGVPGLLGDRVYRPSEDAAIRLAHSANARWCRRRRIPGRRQLPTISLDSGARDAECSAVSSIE